MHWMRIFFFIQVCTFTYVSANAQSFRATLFKTDDGLPAGEINDVFEDSEGLLWLAGPAGLIKYDGQKFLTLDNEPFRKFSAGKGNSAIGLTDHNIISIPSLTPIDLGSIGAHVLFDAKIGNMENSFWVLCDQGLFFIHNGKLKSIGLPESFGTSRQCFFNSDPGQSLLISATGMIGELMEDKGELKVIQKNLELEGSRKYITGRGDQSFMLRNFSVERIFYDSAKKKHAQEKFLLPDDANDFIVLKQDLLMVATPAGVWVTKENEKTFIFFKVTKGNEPHRPDELPFTNVKRLYQSGSGNIWVVHDGGLGLLQALPFNRISYDVPMASFEQASISKNGIIFLGENGLYQCTRSDGMNEFNCTNLEVDFSRGVQTSMVAVENRLWITTSKNYLYYIEDGKNSDYIDLNARGNNIYYLYADSKKNLWVSQAPGAKPIVGTLKITPEMEAVEYGVKEGLVSRMLFVKESPTKEIYCAGIGETTYLFRFDSLQNKFINISAKMHFSYGENFEVHCFDIAADTTVWLATTTGLLRFKKGNVEKIFFDELADSEAIAVVVGNDNTVWFSTDDKGLVHYDPVNDQYTIFDHNSGLATNFMTYRSLHKGEDGTIYAGTREGFFLSRSAAYQWRKTKTPLLRSVQTADGLQESSTFPFNTSLHVNFGSLTYPPRTVEYSYRLTGRHNDDWKKIHYDSIQLLNLSEGKYQLEIKARQIGGYTWSDPLVYSFEVNKIWYSQTPAVLSYIALAALLIIAGIKVYNRELHRQKKLLEHKVLQRTQEIIMKNEEIASQRDDLLLQKKVIEQQNQLLVNAKDELEKKVLERTADLSLSNKELIEQNIQLEEFAFMTAHNLRGPVARLLGLISLFNDNTVKDPENIELVRRIKESTYNLDEVIREMALIVSVKNGIQINICLVNIYLVFQRTLKLFEPEISNRKIQILNQIPPDACVRGAEPYIFSIFCNALANSIKFSDSRKTPIIIAQLIQNEKGTQIIIADNGIGFDATGLREKLFKPYSRLNTSVKGRGLGLYMMKIEMESMRGEVDIQSTVDKGTEVILTFKDTLTEAHQN